jgi:hypothetical protein
MNFEMIDRFGNSLQVVCGATGKAIYPASESLPLKIDGFNVITVSPKSGTVYGFSESNLRILAKREPITLLPASSDTNSKLFLVRSIAVRGNEGRELACQAMCKVRDACGAVGSEISLLIDNFSWLPQVGYRAEHVDGICDAILSFKESGFLPLRTIGFRVWDDFCYFFSIHLAHRLG